MNVRKVIDARVDDGRDGTNVVGGVTGVVAASVGGSNRSSTQASSRHRMVQRGGRTVVDEHELTTAHASATEAAAGDASTESEPSKEDRDDG